MSTKSNHDIALSCQYDDLARQEAMFWGRVRSDSHNPQLWDDDVLFDIFLRKDFEWLLTQVSTTGGNAIDIACGEGNVSIELAKRGMNVQGYDISEERIRRAQIKVNEKLAGESCQAPKFIVSDLNKALLPGCSADVVVAHDALHHLIQIDHVVQQIHFALKPGGRFIVYDYIGMGVIRKFFAALLYAVLPTYQPYAEKLKRAKRLKHFFSSEKSKREAVLRNNSVDRFRDESPFEEISQASILHTIRKYFSIEEEVYRHPFFFYLAPKLLVPRRFKTRMAKLFVWFDQLLLDYHVCPGAYVRVIARKVQS